MGGDMHGIAPVLVAFYCPNLSCWKGCANPIYDGRTINLPKGTGPREYKPNCPWCSSPMSEGISSEIKLFLNRARKKRAIENAGARIAAAQRRLSSLTETSEQSFDPDNVKLDRSKAWNNESDDGIGVPDEQ